MGGAWARVWVAGGGGTKDASLDITTPPHTYIIISCVGWGRGANNRSFCFIQNLCYLFSYRMFQNNFSHLGFGPAVGLFADIPTT